MKFKPLLISLTLGLGLALALLRLPVLSKACPEQSQKATGLAAGMTTDIDRQVRDSQIHIGADEHLSTHT